MDNRGISNLSFEVISLSNMSRSDKEVLLMRLKEELQHVRFWLKKISTSGVAFTSSTDVHPKKKISVSEKVSHFKDGNSGRFKSIKKAPLPPPVSKSYDVLMKQCETLLESLMTHQHASLFNSPVDVVKFKIPDYFQIIKHPMDLGTIKNKLASGSYDSPWGFVSDVRLTFNNAKTYNPIDNIVHTMADNMSKFFEAKWKTIEKKLDAADAHAERKVVALNAAAQPKKRSKPAALEVIQPEMTKWTRKEKNLLKDRLESINLMEDPFLEFFRKNSCIPDEISEEFDIQVDLNSLSNEALSQLEKLLSDHSAGKQPEHQAESEPCVMEAYPTQLNHEGNGQAEEDVDIVNDPPISNYSPVVIEKDTRVRSGESSVSSTSSSDSGSSSSDSDSGSSSGSESDIKAPGLRMVAKENAVCGEALDPDKSRTQNPFDGNRSLGGTVQQEKEAYLKSDSIERDCTREGAKAPTGGQISLEKVYHAAHEKTLDQDKKRALEKLRQDIEELERRQQRKGKARIQVEAEVAEDSGPQTKEEIAAEAMHKRILEREASRQLLSQMKKTVEINENSSFDGTSLFHSLDVGGFQFGASNPLEQLGLSLKVDDEEEE